MGLALIVIPDAPLRQENTVRTAAPPFCQGLKIPRCGFTTGMRLPPNSNPSTMSG
jgi:hypothetical protein